MRTRTLGFIWVPVGALDDEGTLEIAAQLFLGSKLDCDQPRADGMQYETAPPLEELIGILHGQASAGQ